jgi:eukaryotic-like serine/threonine-protein kinase
MSEIWKRWEGRVVEHKYRLESLIGSTDHSVVFLAEYRSPEPRKATLKFVAADIPNAEQLITAWNKAAQLSHPNLLGILQTGKTKIEDMELLYVANEYAEENLAEIIPQRALTADEAREALNAIVEVLVYLHRKNLTHGHICPANILAIGDQLKVSSDTIEPVAEKREMTHERSAYDAPEIPAGAYTAAADVWSLGVTLVEMLTQQPAILPFNENVDPVIPQAVREPFLEIARNTLRRNPERRWTSAQIAERLNPGAVAAKAAVAGAVSAVTASAATSGAVGLPAAPSPQSAAGVQAASKTTPSAAPPPRLSTTVSPLNVPVSQEPAAPLAKQTRPAVPPMRVSAPRTKSSQRETLVLPNYAVPVFVAALIMVGIVALPKILRKRTVATPSITTASAPVTSAVAPPASTQPGATRSQVPAQHKADEKSTAPDAVKNLTPSPTRNAEEPSTSPAVMRSQGNVPTTRNSSDLAGRGEAMDQALPQVSAKALSTISGTVRVVVKAHVDAAGEVTAADLQESGPSAYFADKAVQAAQRWVFSSPEVNGRSVESDWLIRFEYTRDGVKAFPQQVTP